MARKLRQLTPITVTTAGTAVQISASEVQCASVMFQADPLNTGRIYIGDANVDEDNGIVLSPQDSVTVTADPRSNYQEQSLSDFWVDSENDGNVVRVTYLARK